MATTWLVIVPTNAWLPETAAVAPACLGLPLLLPGLEVEGVHVLVGGRDVGDPAGDGRRPFDGVTGLERPPLGELVRELGGADPGHLRRPAEHRPVGAGCSCECEG